MALWCLQWSCVSNALLVVRDRLLSGIIVGCLFCFALLLVFMLCRSIEDEEMEDGQNAGINIRENKATDILYLNTIVKQFLLFM